MTDKYRTLMNILDEIAHKEKCINEKKKAEYLKKELKKAYGLVRRKKSFL